jgi:hypothetical protein
MCTFSVVRPLAGGDVRGPLVHVVVNRDERRSRQTAVPPVVREVDVVRVVMPIDPDGGGTWIAATDRGLVFAVLNGPATSDAGAEVPRPSRGLLIPALVSCLSIDEVWDRLSTIEWGADRPWRLVVVTSAALLEAEPRGADLWRRLRPLPERFMVTSSSFDEARARAMRRELFDEIVAAPDVAAQRRFHEHQWPDRPEFGVVMERDEARTVSRTSVSVAAGHLSLAYDALDGQPSTTISMSTAMSVLRVA